MILLLYIFICFTGFGAIFNFIIYVFSILGLHTPNKIISVIFIIMFFPIMALLIFIYSKESENYNMKIIFNNWKKWRKVTIFF